MENAAGPGTTPDRGYRDNDLEFSAQLSTQRYLLEFVLTNMFAGNLEGLDRVMIELRRLSQSASTASEPASQALLDELTLRSTVHFDRIHQSVRQRVMSARTA
ncbi:hypothetical protein [Variovorax sp. DAIF25]|uniref:hypothetical protein n=1 Tax=Variovorax sp. DAIF25 TaxID=3080983 RepID=UPI003D6C5313